MCSREPPAGRGQQLQRARQRTWRLTPGQQGLRVCGECTSCPNGSRSHLSGLAGEALGLHARLTNGSQLRKVNHDRLS